MRLFIALVLSCWFTVVSVAQDTTIAPFVLGEIHHVQSKVLNEERTINVYLPEGYNPNDTKQKYPIIFLLDGSKNEDFIHTVGLVQYNTFSWVNRMPKCIVVGIANVDRRRDFTYPTTIKKDKKYFPTSGKSDVFIQFLEKELKPYVNKMFNSNGEYSIIGQSLGGLLATEILIKHPEMFSNYIIISPSLWWDNRSLWNELPELNQKIKEDVNVYIGVGKEGHASSDGTLMEEDAKQLYDKLHTIDRIRAIYDYLPNEDHATVGHQALINAFTWVFKQKK